MGGGHLMFFIKGVVGPLNGAGEIFKCGGGGREVSTMEDTMTFRFELCCLFIFTSVKNY